jgi:hypothetical protein
MKPLTYSLIVVASTFSSSAIEITNKVGVSFRGEVLEILPNANGGPAAKIKRDGDGRMFSVPLNALSEKTLIELVLLQNRTATAPRKQDIADVPAPVVGNQPARPAARRGKKVNGFNVVMSSDKTAEDIKVDFEVQRITQEDDDWIKIYGKLTNNYEKTCEFCKVTVELLDRKGQFVIRKYAYSDPTDIGAKQIGNVEISVLSDLLKDAKVDSIVYKVTGNVD